MERTICLIQLVDLGSDWSRETCMLRISILTHVVSACGRLYDSAFAEASDGVLLFPPDLYNQISGEKEEERKAVQKRSHSVLAVFQRPAQLCQSLMVYNLGGMAHVQLSILKIAFFDKAAQRSLILLYIENTIFLAQSIISLSNQYRNSKLKKYQYQYRNVRY